MIWALLACSSPQPDWLTPQRPVAEACAPATASTPRSLRVHLYVADGVDREGLARHTRRMAGYWQERGVRLELDGVDPLPPDAPLDGDLATLRTWAERTRPARADTVLLFAVPRLAAAGSAASRAFTELSALTFEPSLVTAEADAIDLRPVLGESFTPMILVGWDDLDVQRPSKLDLTLAHELGHALGLPHVADRTDLMSRGRWHDCVPTVALP